jgi:RNA-binding protein 39
MCCCQLGAAAASM